MARPLNNFVDGGPLRQILATIGDVETEAACLALSNIADSNDWKAEVRLAIGHLQSAHVAYERYIYDKHEWKALLRTVNLHIAETKNIYVLCLMAICYRYLEDYGNMKKYLWNAETAFHVHRNPTLEEWQEVVGAFTVVMNPLMWGETLYKGYTGELVELSEYSFEDFCKQLRAL